MNWNDLKAVLGFILTIVLVFFVVVFLPAASWIAYECRYYERTTGIETTYNVLAGCYVRSGDKLIPYGEYKARAITNEGVTE